jgi:hypothetical protein
VSRLSESRLSHLAHLVVDGLRKGNFVAAANEAHALSDTKQVLHDFFHHEDHVDELVREKIQSLSRPVPQGSREWDILYRKYFEEEMRRQRK